MSATVAEAVDDYLPTRSPLTTKFTPLPECETPTYTALATTPPFTVTDGQAGINCVPKRQAGAKVHVWEYSPGVYCPHGLTANHMDAQTDFGGPGLPETLLGCDPSGFTCDNRLSTCVSTITTSMLAHKLAPSAKTVSGSAMWYTPTMLPPPIVVKRSALTLMYRSTDVPEGFFADQGARYKKYESFITPTPAADDLTITAKSNEFNAIIAPGALNPVVIGAVVCVGSIVLGFFSLLAFRVLHKRSIKKSGRIGKPRAPGPMWRIGAVPTLPSILAIPFGIFALVFGSRRDWQEDVILRWDSKDAVLRFTQILSFLERMCATTLAWSIIRDCGWLLLSTGMPARHFVEVWNLSATGGGYGNLLSGLWHALRVLSLGRWALFLVLMLFALAADWTGNAMIASTGIANSTGSIPQVASAVPFTSIKRRYAPSENGSPEMGNYIFSSGTAYPHILRHEESGTIAFLPVQVGSPAPSHYNGVALFGNFETHCQDIPINGNVSGNQNEFGFTHLLNYMDMDLSSWKYPEKPLSLSGHISTTTNLAPQGSKLLASNFTTVVTIPWQKFDDLDPINRFGDTMYIPKWNDAHQSVHLFAAIRVFNQFKYTEQIGDPLWHGAASPGNNWNTSVSSGTGFYYEKQTYKWEFKLCRTQVPYRLGTIRTQSISTSTNPVSPCDPTKSILCPSELRFRPSNFTTITWDGATVALHNLNATISDKNTAWTALQPFRIIGLPGPTQDKGIIYCHECTMGALASKHFAKLVSHASSTAEFTAAFSGSILHAIAATYRAQLPFFEGAGPAKWAVPGEVTLIIHHRWLWIGVCYTWALVIISIATRMWVLSVVGVERSGSGLSVAAVATSDPDGPLKPLIDRGYMHRKDDFDIDMRARPKVWEQEIKMGVLPNGKYGIGRTETTGSLRRRGMGNDFVQPESVEMLARMQEGGRSEDSLQIRGRE